MKIACPVLAAVLIALSVLGVQQARRVWHEPAAVLGRRPPRSAWAGAALMICFAVLLVGGSVAFDVPGAAGEQGGAALIGAGLAGIIIAMIGMETTRRFGRPAFLVPPALRAGAGSAAGRRAESAPAEAGTAGTEPAEAARPDAVPASAAEAAPAEAGAAGAGPVAAGPAAAVPAGAGVAEAQGVASADEGEFIVIAGRGSHLGEEGRLVLTTRRLALGEPGPQSAVGDGEWLLDGLREVVPGPGESGLTLRFAGGREESFTVDRDRDLWVATAGKLLSLAAPVTSWYGDPADDERAVPVPDGSAVVVLTRVEGEQQDRGLGYRVMLDRRRAGKIKRGQRVELPVPPGRHVLALRTTWVGSRTIPFEAQAGQVLRFCCEPGGFPGMTRADMERDQAAYIRLRRL
jgi:hypothetical protein